MCRPDVQSSYRVSYTNRARPDHDEFFARIYFVSFSVPSSSAECEREELGYRHLGPSEAGEDMVLPGEVRSTSTGMITLPAKNYSLRTDTGDCRSFPWNATRPRKAVVAGSRATGRLYGPSRYPRSTTLLDWRSPLSRSFSAQTVNVTSPFPSEKTCSFCAASMLVDNSQTVNLLASGRTFT